MNTTYVLIAVKEDGWWIIYAPIIDWHTQAKNDAEIEEMGRDLIANILEIDPASFNIDIWKEQPAFS